MTDPPLSNNDFLLDHPHFRSFRCVVVLKTLRWGGGIVVVSGPFEVSPTTTAEIGVITAPALRARNQLKHAFALCDWTSGRSCKYRIQLFFAPYLPFSPRQVSGPIRVR